MMRAVLRPLCAVAFLMLVAPALATDASVTFQCCSYTPNQVRILPGESVTIGPAMGVTFDQHPLHYADNVGNTLTGTAPAQRTFPQDGIYIWYCAIHGHPDGTGMAGKAIVTTNTPPTARFTASAGDVPSGAEVRFDASASSDPDAAQFINYRWDLDGDGIDDPGQTAVNPSMVYANTGTQPRTVTVRLTAIDTNADAVGPESSTKTMTITVEPGSQPPPTTGPPPPDTVAPAVHLTLAKSLTVRTKLRLTFTTSEPATALATLRVGGRVVQAGDDFTTAGSHTLTLKLSKRVRRALRHRRKVTLTLEVSDPSGNATVLKRTLKLKAR